MGESDFHHPPLPYGWSVRSAYSAELAFRRDDGGSLRSLNASVSKRAVPLRAPPQSPAPSPFFGSLLLPFQVISTLWLRIIVLTRLNRFTCVTAAARSLCLAYSLSLPP